MAAKPDHADHSGHRPAEKLFRPATLENDEWWKGGPEPGANSPVGH
jgi:hypothetical protein